MRKISVKKYAISLYEIVKEGKVGISQTIDNFVKLLIKNNDLSRVDKIIEAFDEYAKEQEGMIEVEAKTARVLDKKDRESIVENLEKTLNKKVSLKEEQDKELIGGIVLKYKDTVVDGSIKKKLESLNNQLIK